VEVGRKEKENILHHLYIDSPPPLSPELSDSPDPEPPSFIEVSVKRWQGFS